MKKPLLVLIVALGLIRPAWADFQDGLAAYERGDYQTALREWHLLAKRGVAEAEFNLGRAKDVREVLPGAEKRNRDLLEPAFPK